MAVSFKYWDVCVDPQDLEALWADPDVRAEWTNAGESPGSKVHFSRDPDGQPYLTQIEMKAVAGIVVWRHFVSHIELQSLKVIGCLYPFGIIKNPRIQQLESCKSHKKLWSG